MAGFDKIYITTEGAKLAAKTMEGKILKFSHAQLGSGTLTDTSPSALKKRTALVKKVMECDILKAKKTADTQATISFLLKNTDAPSSFYFKELGIFAIDPDTKTEVLFAYSNAGNNAEYINNSISELVEKYIDVVTIIDNASNVSIVLDDTQIYITEKEMNEAIKAALSVTGKNYGIRRKIVDNTNPAWERIADSVGLVANATKNGSEVQNDFDNLYPWSEIKTYNYDTTNKKVTAYIGDPNFAFDGSNGEVLTKIPEFWYKREVKEGYEYIYIADYARANYKHSKEFSIGRYTIGLDEEGNAHSYSGLIPAKNKNIGAFRTLAKAVGEGFCQLDTRYFILQMLYLVEYAHYNSQSKLGNGNVNFYNQKALIAENTVNRIIVKSSSNAYVGRNISIGATDAWNASIAADRVITRIEDFDNGTITGKAIYFDGEAVNIAVGNTIWANGQVAGQCDELGMRSGTLNNDGCHSMIYRGIENIFGNMYQFVDGINIKDYIAYVCDDPSQYASDVFVAPYKQVGYTNLMTKDIYPSKLGYDENHEQIALPVEANGTSGTGICDYYYCETGNRVALVGGVFNHGSAAGLFCWYLHISSSRSYWDVGGRLLKYQ